MQIYTRAFGGFAYTCQTIWDTRLGVATPDTCQVWCNENTFVRLRDRRCDQVTPGYRAKLFVKQAESRWRTGRHDGCIANFASKIIKQAITRNRRASLTVFFPHIWAHVRARAVIKIDHPACDRGCMKVMQGAHAA